MPIKKLSEEDFEDIYALSAFAFQYDLTEEELERKKQEAATHEIWGWMEEKLAAKVHIIPLQCWIGGRKFQMGGVNAVATWPEYRRKGIVRQLLHHALLEMKKEGMTVSYLHPFSIPFYRKFGYELAFANKKYTIPMEKLKQTGWQTAGFVKREKEDYAFLQSIYTAFAIRYNGMLVRDDHWWKYRVYNGDFHTAVSYTSSGNADGYLIYQVKNNTLSVKEIVYHSTEALKTLMQFIANHDSMAEKIELTFPENDLLPLLFDDPSFQQEVSPYFMARIVDVEAFLQQYPFLKPAEPISFSLSVKDEFLPENTGTYLLEYGNKDWKITKQEAGGQDITCSIQSLSMLLLGYRRPEDLHALGLISGGHQAVNLLAAAIPDKKTFLPDFF